MSKIKGTNAERELINLFWGAGWAAIRSAGSGSMHFPSPDLLVGNKIRRLAIEAKATKEEKKYFTTEEIDQLVAFSDYFGAEPWLAIRFDRSPWVFVTIDNINKTKENFVFDKKNIKNGLSFEELIGVI